MDAKSMRNTMTAGKSEVVDDGCSSFQSQLRSYSCRCKPGWLLSTLTDIEQRITTLALDSNNDKDLDQADTFAQRAEFYYQKRPQLLSLLQDLYNTYLSLADRYCQSLHKHNHHHYPNYDNQNNHSEEDYQSDAESSLSYQLSSTPVSTIQQYNPVDDIISELVMKKVEYDLMAHELGIKERQSHESSRKIELQRSLLEVLESERLILLNENTGLRYKMGVLLEENKGLASELMFMKRKAGELARCVLRMRDDHRVCMMSRKIEYLQGKIYWLEKRNQEYYQLMVKREKMECPSCKVVSMKSKDVEGVISGSCFHGVKDYKKGIRFSKLWNKIKNSDILFFCKPHPSTF